MAQGTIWVGDLARALGALRPDAEAFELLVTRLGVPRITMRLEDPPPPSKDPGPRVELPLADIGVPPPRVPPQPPTTAFAPVPASTELVTLAAETPDIMTFPSPGVNLLPEPGPLPEDPPPHKALVPRCWRSGVVSAAVATRAFDGEVDVPSLVEHLASRRPLVRLPRREVPTLRYGAQVLLDFSDGMLPFVRDRDDLILGIEQTVGAGRVDVQHFAGCPPRGLGTVFEDEVPWRPPPAGIPVVLLTNLGLGGEPLSEDRATPDEWLDFARRVRRARCPLVAFVPYESSRIPPALREVFRIITWDRTTTASRVRPRRGRARRWG